jgi:dihydrofolate synthase/folylpolyglutamate synthase
MTKYSDLVRQLYSANLYLRVKMGLENIHRLHDGLQKPLDQVKTIVHVAGTNGKGSVCMKVARALQSSGLSTGLFVSPHIACFRERMQMNGAYITEEQVERLLPQVFDAVEKQQIPGTFFEMTTALSFLYYKEMAADAVVLETGLGGRLDSTNICRPSVTVVTSISKDHTKILGSTEVDIAREKGGIFKRGVPVVLGPMRNQLVLDTLQEIAHQVGAGPVYLVPPSSSSDESFSTTDEQSSSPAIGSQDFVVENERTARTVLHALRKHGGLVMDDETVSSVLSSALATNPPCRFQEVVALGGAKFVLDVAHNPEALTKLFDRFQRIHGLDSMDGVQVVVGMSVDKDLQTCMDIIKESGLRPENILLVQSSHPRAAPASSLATYLPDSTVFESGEHASSIAMGISYAIERAGRRAAAGAAAGEARDMSPIIVCGSLYIMDEVQQVLGIGRVDQTDPSVVQQAWSDRKTGNSPPTTNAEDLQVEVEEKKEKQGALYMYVGVTD